MTLTKLFQKPVGLCLVAESRLVRNLIEKVRHLGKGRHDHYRFFIQFPAHNRYHAGNRLIIRDRGAAEFHYYHNLSDKYKLLPINIPTPSIPLFLGGELPEDSSCSLALKRLPGLSTSGTSSYNSP